METGKHGLKRELKLWDRVPMQITVIMWLGWTGFTAMQAPTQLALWLLAIVLLYLPMVAGWDGFLPGWWSALRLGADPIAQSELSAEVEIG